jgi:hypothetical protein
MGISLLSEVLNEWASHFFFTLFNIAKGTMLEGGGSFRTPPAYANPDITLTGIDGYGIHIFIVTRVIIWLVFALGIALVAFGLLEKHKTS